MREKTTIESLTNRQQKLFDFYEHMAKKRPDYYVPRREVLYNIKEYGYNGKDNLYKLACAIELNKDIQALKTNLDITEILISKSGKNGGNKFATTVEELDRWKYKSLFEGLGKMKIYGIAKSKMEKNGQLSHTYSDKEEESIKTIKAIIA